MFDAASFLITFRESLEAAIIIGILLAYTSKINKRELNKQILVGALAGIVTSVIVAIIFQFVIKGFSNYQEIFEGIIMIIATLLITWMIIYMSQTSQNLRSELEEKVRASLTDKQKYSLLVVAFISVMREGVETVLFLSGVEMMGTERGSILLSGFLGLMMGIIVAILVFVSGKKIKLKIFFVITSIILILFAAGMFTFGFHEFQELGWFGGSSSWLQQQVWDTSKFLDDSNSELGKFLRVLFGYQDKPTILEVLSYIAYYLILTSAYFTVRYLKKRQKSNKDNKLALNTELHKN